MGLLSTTSIIWHPCVRFLELPLAVSDANTAHSSLYILSNGEDRPL